MQRLLKIDPRPFDYDSIAEAHLEVVAAEVVPDVETADWRPIAPTTAPPIGSIAFVDGVQRIELRLSAEGDGYPIPGALVACAAGAICPSRVPPLEHVQIARHVILAKGATAPVLSLTASNGQVVYQPAQNAGEDFESINHTLNDLRAGLEVEVIRELLRERLDLVIVDGRLPDVRDGPVLGLIKTLQNLYLAQPDHLDTLTALKTGERSPVFVIQRPRRAYYSWFVCLCSPGPFDLSLSGLVRLEMDDSVSREQVFRFADGTAALLPSFASTPNRDARAPQNLLPIGQLERELRHRLGDPELLRRLLFKTFQEESPQWNP